MSYYRIIDGQRYDRKLLELAQSFTQGQGDGRISQADSELLFGAMQDGRGITAAEKRTLAYLLKQFKWTEKAEAWIKEQLGKPNLREALEHIILEEFHLLRLRFSLDEEEAVQQMQVEGTAVALANALREALKSFLYDGSSPESPRNLVMEVHGYLPGQMPYAEQLLDNKLREYMDAGELMLIPRYESISEDDWDFNPPEGREPTLGNWIFGLYLPTLSDHYYWAIVSRNGTVETYNYGFN
ncbi:MAG: hypothetical protein KDC66_08470 [Phaeodactylibacter sp.]|nr:hypothetical protein [Phaeodactylibacter sp.]MCB9273489.1 hypothetical protein [Lewinellaceae bacterium]